MSKFDYPDPGTDPEYCNPLAADEPEPDPEPSNEWCIEGIRHVALDRDDQCVICGWVMR